MEQGAWILGVRLNAHKWQEGWGPSGSSMDMKKGSAWCRCRRELGEGEAWRSSAVEWREDCREAKRRQGEEISCDNHRAGRCPTIVAVGVGKSKTR